MAFRFVHAADIHLDSPLKSLAFRNPEVAELVGNATRRAFSSIADLCLEERVDALVLSGDLYDGDQTSMKTARFLATEVGRLHEAGIRVFIIRGNHDALSRITKEMVLPDTTKIFGGRADAVTVPANGNGREVVFHGISFAQPHAPESLLPKYRPPVEGAINIGLMHTSLDGSASHDPYAPCKATDLEASGFRYWALGHVHGRSVAGTRCSIVMPGMPQGRDVGESGPKTVTLATIADNGSIGLEERLTSVAQFERVAVDLGGATEWREIVGRVASRLGAKRDAVASEHLVARLTLAGATPLAWRIRRDADLLRAEAEQIASSLGRTWIDKVEIAVSAPSTSADEATGAALIDLRRLMSGEVQASSAYVLAATTALEQMRDALPQECRRVLGDNEAALRSVLDILAKDGAEDVLARLARAGGEET
ncbi:DNA repair exonuclease [Beijerinckia sp. L45]|uniref:metallophosphoesterase family protein n=1 Tax=Beijerinckia sp. L45 TaxID=1641855 RepID=UPI00131C5D2D|nr:DNA repair exonuclease [Beijerinckia sp. L45]